MRLLRKAVHHRDGEEYDAADDNKAQARPQADKAVAQRDIGRQVARHVVQHPPADDGKADRQHDHQDEAQRVEQELDLIARKLRGPVLAVGPTDRAQKRACRTVREIDRKNEREPEQARAGVASDVNKVLLDDVKRLLRDECANFIQEAADIHGHDAD